MNLYTNLCLTHRTFALCILRLKSLPVEKIIFRPPPTTVVKMVFLRSSFFFSFFFYYYLYVYLHTYTNWYSSVLALDGSDYVHTHTHTHTLAHYRYYTLFISRRFTTRRLRSVFLFFFLSSLEDLTNKTGYIFA